MANEINHLFINNSKSICLSSSCGKCSCRDLHVFGDIIDVYAQNGHGRVACAPHTVIYLLLSMWCWRRYNVHSTSTIVNRYIYTKQPSHGCGLIDGKRLDFDFERVSDLNDGVHDHHSPLIGKLIDDNIDDVFKTQPKCILTHPKSRVTHRKRMQIDDLGKDKIIIIIMIKVGWNR